MKVHDRVAAGLRELGVEVVFGLMGEGNLRVLARFDDIGGTFVGAVTEGAAVSMADGYARVGRRLGVASVTHGPGATNALTALTEAVRARTPLLVLTGDTPPRPDHLQRFDLRGLSALSGADYVRVGAAERAAADLAEAARRATTRSCPVVLDLPVPLQRSEVPAQPALRPVASPAAGAPDEHALDHALGMLASARRPVVLAGRGAVDARAEALALASALGAPVGTTLLAKGMFSGELHDLGVVGTLGTEIALRTVQDSDCLLVLGAGMNRYTTIDGSLVEGKAVIQVDRDPNRIGGEDAVVLGLVADARTASAMMLVRLREACHRPAAHGGAELSAALDAEARRTAETEDGPRTLDPRTVMRWLDRIAPRERVVVTDTGRFAYAPWRLLGTTRPTDFTHTCNFASIGLGLATAIGAAVVSGRTTIAVAGDGGSMMSLIELSTAVRLGLPLLVVVCNDGAYGMEYRHLQAEGLDPSPARNVWPDISAVGAAVGARVASVRTLDDLDTVADQVAGMASVGRGPLLLDVHCDPDVDVSASA